MVECELVLLNRVNDLTDVLIDTWWNVNLNILSIIIIFFIVLIDTWWNVNEIEYFRDNCNFVF